MSNIKVIDNFLDGDTFLKLTDDIVSKTKHKWSYSNFLNFNCDEDDYQFVCMLVDNADLAFSEAKDLLYPIMDKLKANYFNNEKLLVSRAKLNFFGMYEKNKGMGMHTDLMNEEEYYTAIFYLNDNNGGTKIKSGEFVKSKSNRLLLFKGQILHESIVQTDKTKRFLFNINFYRKSQFARD